MCVRTFSCGTRSGSDSVKVTVSSIDYNSLRTWFPPPCPRDFLNKYVVLGFRKKRLGIFPCLPPPPSEALGRTPSSGCAVGRWTGGMLAVTLASAVTRRAAALLLICLGGRLSVGISQDRARVSGGVTASRKTVKRTGGSHFQPEQGVRLQPWSSACRHRIWLVWGNFTLSKRTMW